MKHMASQKVIEKQFQHAMEYMLFTYFNDYHHQVYIAKLVNKVARAGYWSQKQLP